MADSELNVPTIAIDGRSYHLLRLRLEDYLDLERRYAAARPDLLACVRAQLEAWPESLKRALFESAFEAMLRPVSPTIDELRRWLVSIDGLSAALELALGEAVSRVSAESCRRVVYEADGARREALLRAVEFAVGVRLGSEVDSGNEHGRSAAANASAEDLETEPDWIGGICATD